MLPNVMTTSKKRSRADLPGMQDGSSYILDSSRKEAKSNRRKSTGASHDSFNEVGEWLTS
jgi:hypothetical protein